MPQPSKIRFDRFEYDPASGELHLDGARVPLQPQPSRLLALLLASPGTIVTREAIRAALWGGEVHVDFDRSLNFCVARLRSALGDSAAEPRFVETLPTRGYRWVAPLEAGAPAIDPRPAERHGGESIQRSRRFAGIWPAMLASMVALSTFFVLILSPGPFGPPKVVVVPFQNETGSPDLDRLAKGVSDATVVRLSESARLRVIGNAAGLRLSFRPPDMKAMGESLGAQYLVLGQMKRDERRMRIVAHLIRVRDQTHVWANTYDTDLLDLTQQASIANEIAAAIATRIGKG